jgi:hypothetical protein
LGELIGHRECGRSSTGQQDRHHRWRTVAALGRPGTAHPKQHGPRRRETHGPVRGRPVGLPEHQKRQHSGHGDLDRKKRRHRAQVALLNRPVDKPTGRLHGCDNPENGPDRPPREGRPEHEPDRTPQEARRQADAPSDQARITDAVAKKRLRDEGSRREAQGASESIIGVFRHELCMPPESSHARPVPMIVGSASETRNDSDAAPPSASQGNTEEGRS